MQDATVYELGTMTPFGRQDRGLWAAWAGRVRVARVGSSAVASGLSPCLLL